MPIWDALESSSERTELMLFGVRLKWEPLCPSLVCPCNFPLHFWLKIPFFVIFLSRSIIKFSQDRNTEQKMTPSKLDDHPLSIRRETSFFENDNDTAEVWNEGLFLRTCAFRSSHHTMRSTRSRSGGHLLTKKLTASQSTSMHANVDAPVKLFFASTKKRRGFDA